MGKADVIVSQGSEEEVEGWDHVISGAGRPGSGSRCSARRRLVSRAGHVRHPHRPGLAGSAGAGLSRPSRMEGRSQAP